MTWKQTTDKKNIRRTGKQRARKEGRVLDIGKNSPLIEQDDIIQKKKNLNSRLVRAQQNIFVKGMSQSLLYFIKFPVKIHSFKIKSRNLTNNSLIYVKTTFKAKRLFVNDVAKMQTKIFYFIEFHVKCLFCKL